MKQYNVRVVGSDDYCLMWGDDSPRWQGTLQQATERAKALTETSAIGTKFEVVPASDEP